MRTLKALVAIPVVALVCFVGFLRDDVPDIWREIRGSR